MAKISLHAILGSHLASTMKVRGILGTKSVLILIDSGSTHNFISNKVVTTLNLHCSSLPTFGVQVGDDVWLLVHLYVDNWRLRSKI